MQNGFFPSLGWIGSWLVIVPLAVVMEACLGSGNYNLDTGIPGVETPVGEIAYLRTKWRNGKHIKTAFYDRQNRLREVFWFGRSNGKRRFRYKGSQLVETVVYDHSDSSPRGHVSVSRYQNFYDRNGRLVRDRSLFGYYSDEMDTTIYDIYQRHLAYKPNGDTIVVRKEKVKGRPDPESKEVVLAKVNRWYHDEQNQLVRYYHLQVDGIRKSRSYTVLHFSRRFAYDTRGRLSRIWYEAGAPGRLIRPFGPDTIHCAYDRRGRLIQEKLIYTTNLRPNRDPAIDPGKSHKTESKENAIRTITEKVEVFSYQYEAFDPKKHLPVQVPKGDLWTSFSPKK